MQLSAGVNSDRISKLRSHQGILPTITALRVKLHYDQRPQNFRSHGETIHIQRQKPQHLTSHQEAIQVQGQF